MKVFIISICLLYSLSLNSQYLKKISAFDNNYNNNSGIIAISDTAVYEYSWYFQKWLKFPDNGLVKVNGVVKLDYIAAFDNNSLNPSGIYVVSDTAVFVYNYYAQQWFPLSNDGLIRHNGKVQINALSAHKEFNTEEHRIHVISDTLAFRYNRFSQIWQSLSNSGLIVEDKRIKYTVIKSEVYPNPTKGSAEISFTLPVNYSGIIRIALYNNQGVFLKEIENQIHKGGNHSIEFAGSDLPSGIYFYEISGKDFSHVKKILIID